MDSIESRLVLANAHANELANSTLAMPHFYRRACTPQFIRHRPGDDDDDEIFAAATVSGPSTTMCTKWHTGACHDAHEQISLQSVAFGHAAGTMTWLTQCHSRERTLIAHTCTQAL